MGQLLTRMKRLLMLMKQWSLQLVGVNGKNPGRRPPGGAFENPSELSFRNVTGKEGGG